MQVFDLDVVVNIGLAAGVDKSEQSLGDIIVANKIRYYERGKQHSAGFSIEPEYSDLQSEFAQSLQTANWADWPLGTSIGGNPRQVHFGTVASGEKVITDEEFIKALKAADRKIIGLEMESYGISAAALGRKEKVLLIRGISDFADATKNDYARLSAMEGAVLFFEQALRRGIFTRDHEARFTAVPTNIKVTLTSKETQDGVPNTYVQVAGSHILNVFIRRKSLIDDMIDKYNTMGKLKRFCTELAIDFDDISGDTKADKAVSIINFIEKERNGTIEDLEAIIKSDEQKENK